MLSAKAFWDFSLQIYADHSVKQACLALQDEYQLNVNILLLCRYMQWHDEALDAIGFRDLLEAIESSERQLDVHRKTRKRYKEVDPVAYQHALHNELELEKLQQQQLIQCVNLTPRAKQPLDNFNQYLIATELKAQEGDLLANINVIRNHPLSRLENK